MHWQTRISVRFVCTLSHNSVHAPYSHDTVSPTDYNECVNNNGDCNQTCINTIPGHQCDCIDGYTLDSDNTSCVANAVCTEDGCTCLDGFMDESGSASGGTSGSESLNCVGKE